MVKYLVRAGADPDLTDFMGRNALFQARYRKNYDTAAYLESVMKGKKKGKPAWRQFNLFEEKQNESVYNERYAPMRWLLWFVGILSLIASLGPMKRHTPLKIWLAFSLLWTGWVWVFLYAWVKQLTFMSVNGRITLPVIALPFLTLLLTLVFVSLIRDFLGGKKILFSIPSAWWERIFMAIFGSTALLYPLYIKFWDIEFGQSPLAGSGLVPTLMLAGLLFSASDGMDRTQEIRLLFAVLITLFQAWAGHGENLILLPLALYMGFKLFRKRGKIKTNP